MTTDRFEPVVALDRTDVEGILRAFAARDLIPGASVAVVTPQGRVLAHAGVADRERGRPVGDRVAFCIGSVSKTFTATAVLRLRDEGLVSLDDLLTAYVPEASAFRDPEGALGLVTLRGLLQHTSGLQGEPPTDDLRRWEPLSIGDVLREPERVSMAIAPGSAFKYSNLGYDLLGEVVARASGRPYVEFVHTEILEPLGMLDTGVLGDELPGVVRAQGHGPLRSKRMREPVEPSSESPASGGWWSTAADLATWLEAQRDGPAAILPRASLEEMHRPTVVTEPGRGSYGLGWRSYHRGGRTTIGHGGLVAGFESRIEIDLSRGAGVAALMSAIGPDDPAARLAEQLLEAVPGPVADPPSTPAPTPMRGASSGSGEASGSYREIGFDWTVALDVDQAGRVRLVDGPTAWDLSPTDQRDRYLIPGGRAAGEPLVVLRDDRGEVDAINIAGFPLARVDQRSEEAGEPNGHQ